ncbi:phosphate/phosphite/phosphonate ABC transporter substrate-binding protein [Rubrobacter marinus]|uniref:Phosphate/phosphite/phosphonate ABC transporter substrate-binding protein n=1 Tax=Rubrobacter marinus TaxID=2653852 RepID=A0A6G8PYK7_9ACTN|nr:phosphate/phosphite/phosphonate ABC transporter substrate-binding protein [Rubrobacter marinus]
MPNQNPRRSRRSTRRSGVPLRGARDGGRALRAGELQRRGRGDGVRGAGPRVLRGLTYVQARERAEVHPLVTEINPRTHDTTYRSVIIVPEESPVREVSELRGRDFAFGSVSSTSGSLYPSIMLREAGVDYRTDLGEVTYTGGHDATAQAVAGGRVDAGGIEDRILYRLEEEGVIEGGSVRVIEESDPIQGYPWVVRSELPDDLEGAITDAYLSMQDPDLLDLLGAEGYERVEAGDYDYVEEQARELDLLTESQ